MVEEEGAFNGAQIWQILEDLLPVLQLISDRHIIHRDIKPENIIRRTPPNPKGEANVIVDFSAAKVVTEIDCLTDENNIGSPEYAAPEQIKGKAVFANGSWDKTVKLWNVNTGAEICTLTGHQLQVNSVAFSPQGQILASASYDRTIRLWQISCQTEFKNCPCYALLGILSGHAWAVLTVAFSPDGKILATGSDDKTIKLWDVNTGQLISTLLGHSWSVVSVAFTADGKTLISASWDKTVKLWRVSTAQEIVTLYVKKGRSTNAEGRRNPYK